MTSPNPRSGTGLSRPAPAFSSPAASFPGETNLLRGGRLRKTSRGIFTFAPFLATASAVALGALLSLTPTDSAHAGNCSGTAPVYECSGAADMANDTTANLNSVGNQRTVVTESTTSPFGINVAMGHAINLVGSQGPTGIMATFSGDITTRATNGDGIYGFHGGSADFTLTVGNVTGGRHGIDVRSTLSAHATTMSITANGAVTGTAAEGIDADHVGPGDLTITINSGASASGTTGIHAATTHASSNIILDISGNVTGTGMADTDAAIAMTGGASQKLTLNTGAVISGNITADATTSTLELAGASGSGSLDLSTVSGFSTFNKMGAGTWTLSGTQDAASAFTSADVMAGTLQLNDAALALGDSTTLTIASGATLAIMGTSTATISGGTVTNNGTLTFPDGATLRLAGSIFNPGSSGLTVGTGSTLEVAGTSTLMGALNNSAGAISLAMSGSTATDDTLTVTGDFTTGGTSSGGTLTLQVNLNDGTADRLVINGNLAGATATAVTLVGVGSVPASVSATLPILVDVANDSTGVEEGDFTFTDDANGAYTFDFETAYDATEKTWTLSNVTNVVSTAPTGPGTGGGNGPGTGGGGMPPPMPVMPECEEQSTMGSFTCRGAFTEGQTLAAESGESLNVMADPGFSITVNTGNALTLTGAADSTGMVVSLGGATISSTASDGIGIDADHAGSGDVTITASGAVSGGDTGIDVTHSGSGGNVSVTADDVSGGTGISAAITSTDNTAGSISVTVGGRVSGTGMAEGEAAISMSGGASQSLTLNTGARISGDITADADTATLTLTGGSGSSSLNLSTLSGFNAFEKTGNGTWELTGVQGTMDGFTNANVRGGTLRLNDATLRPGANTLTIASGAILEVMGESTVAGALSSTGAISLAVGDDGTDDQLTVSGAFSGTVTMNADLSNPESPAADQLVLNGSGSNSVTLNLRVAANEDLELTPAQLTALQNALIGGSANNVGITAGDCNTTRTGSCSFSASGGNLTGLTITLAAADAAVYESYAATLTELGRLSSRQQRISGRTYSPGQPVWGQIQAGNTTLEPAVTSEGSVEYDLQDIRARFGFDVPLHHLQDAEIFPITLGMNAWIAEGESDITASNGTGTLESDAFGFAATATLEQADNGLYADAQLQYAAFSSDMASGGSELASNQGADSFSASAEVGMRLPALHGFTLTPQVQLVWSDVEFDDFSDSKEVLVSLADGETLTARLGLAAEHALQLGGLGDLAGDGTFRAAADLHLPLDGKTGIRIAEESFTSDLQEVAFSLSAGAVFSLTEAATLSADLATTHGSETETYRASLSARLAF